MDTKKKLGNIIRAKRVAARYNQEELANILPFRGWYSHTISMLESAERNLTLEEAVYMAKVLGCPLEELAAPFTEEVDDWEPKIVYAKKQTIRAEIEKLQKELYELEIG